MGPGPQMPDPDGSDGFGGDQGYEPPPLPDGGGTGGFDGIGDPGGGFGGPDDPGYAPPPLPDGADAVVPLEQTELIDSATVRLVQVDPRPGQHVLVTAELLIKVDRRPAEDEARGTQGLTRAEALLTMVRARSAPMDDQFRATARELLTMTRLLLDSPAADDAAFRALLQDIELVLAQVVQLGPAEAPENLDLITEGLNERDVLPRLRTAIPAGQASLDARGET